MEEIKFFNREKNSTEIEKIYGGAVVQWLYNSVAGNFFSHILCKAPISRAYGFVQSNSLLSKHKAPAFVQKFKIQMHEYVEKNYQSFNDFFIREFRPGARPFVQVGSQMPAFAEARYFGYKEILENVSIPVKGIFLNPKDLIVNNKWQDIFIGGPLMIARLCPVDYHRFHFPDDGNILDEYRVHGQLHSVNPIALKKKEDILQSLRKRYSAKDIKLGQPVAQL